MSEHPVYQSDVSAAGRSCVVDHTKCTAYCPGDSLVAQFEIEAQAERNVLMRWIHRRLHSVTTQNCELLDLAHC